MYKRRVRGMMNGYISKLRITHKVTQISRKTPLSGKESLEKALVVQNIYNKGYSSVCRNTSTVNVRILIKL